MKLSPITRFSFAYVCITVFLFSSSVQASSNTSKLPKQDWSFSGLFGTYDRASAKRGFQVYTEVCSGCHSMDLLSYRHLAGINFSEEEIKAIATDVEITDGPNDDGDMFERPGLPSDRFVSPYENAKAAAASNNGKMPPDLSLMTKARIGGPDYLYALLTGYTDEPPEGIEIPEGGNYNKYYPGNIIAMAQPLSEDAVEYPNGVKATEKQLARDVTTFLAWAAEPEMEERKMLGVKVLIFLLVLTGMLYAVKRKIWEDHH